MPASLSPTYANGKPYFSAQGRAGRPLRFSGLEEGGTLTVKTLDLVVDAMKLPEKVTLELSSDLLLDRAPGAASITAIVSDLVDDKGNVSVERAKIKVG